MSLTKQQLANSEEEQPKKILLKDLFDRYR